MRKLFKLAVVRTSWDDFYPNETFIDSVPYEIRLRWYNALISGKYTQGQQTLCDNYGRLCCLGVGAAEFGCSVELMRPFSLLTPDMEFTNLLYGPGRLKVIDDEYNPIIANMNGAFVGVNVNAASLNDFHNLTFKQIAQLICPEEWLRTNKWYGKFLLKFT